MIHEVDESLRALIRRDVVGDAKVDISFEAPSKDWSARRQGPTLNLYLYEIREDLTRREILFEEVRDDKGRIVERRMPPRRFKLSYLVTAWTQRPEDEHRLLSAMLACMVSRDTLPEDVLEGDLAKHHQHIRATIGLPLPADRAISEVWTALGGELKPSLDLVVTIPFPPQTARLQPVGPWVTEEPRFELVGTDGEREGVGGRPRRGRKGAAAEDEEDPEWEVVKGGKTEKGREFRLRTLPREEP